MSFTVEDFHDLIELLAQHPEWRAELRRHVLSDELLELPALVRQLIDAQIRTDLEIAGLVAAHRLAEARMKSFEARLEQVGTQVERVSTQVERMGNQMELMGDHLRGLDSRLDRLTLVVGELAAAQGRTETLVGRFEDRLGDIDGRVLEGDFARRGPAYLGPMARRLRVIESGPLADMLDDAVDDGRLTESERATIMLTDTVLTGRRRDTGEDVYLLVEISGRIDVHDVERAAERARLLEKLGRPVLTVVAGRRIDADVAALALHSGVWYALGGRVTAPQSA